jgi:AraC-like DNA-binding protein
MTLEEMQFASFVVMALLMLKLLTLRIRPTSSRTQDKKDGGNGVLHLVRRLMVCGTAIVALQFLLQLLLGLRAMGITQGVMLNLTLFIPASWAFSLSILLMQRQGRLNPWDKWIGGLAWAVTMALIVIAVWKGGEALPCDTYELRIAEKIGSGCYIAMQGYYFYRHLTNLGNMQVDMDNYYDSDMSRKLQWMRLSIIALMVMAFFIPIVIFATSKWLLAGSFIVYLGIPYFIDSFCYYARSSTPAKILAAEQNAEEETKTTTTFSLEKMQRVEQAVEQWTARGGYLKSGILQPIAAAEMGIPKYLLSAWLSQQGKKFNPWLADLRIEEAKRQLKAHPDWSNDAIAQYCGFADRTTLQRTFKEKTGLTPTQFIQNTQASPTES